MSDAAQPEYTAILTEVRGRVGWITLNRPEALNALNSTLVTELIEASLAFDASPEIGCIVITGSERAFAAGADIKEMAELGFSDMFLGGPFPGWGGFERMRTPVIAAVAGFALGGGCELAMMCDFILAADTAKFGQPEINLGVLPGFGGSQRLPRAIGKAKAAEMVLTGRMMRADEAERSGLVARVVPADELLADAEQTAATIAAKSLPALYSAKDALQAAQEMPLSEGLRFERLAFAAAFATADQKEGMRAFAEKRDANFTHR
ncbi:enoyl-CoA hydratase [Leucobacter chromiireducens]|uniref:Enoyl-CoA hydratase n=1 Tax=Leucobacter chromiireducens subsp. solipictus TaxID=398235 RepID=A0ABS1SFN8_9MICO|nr:enoyl-CoA hydratase [Leucobacter chromiireducens]MBL3678123.1 enoyl-CoA hydratase [Leucobacter chromiireducens subsp. solipictus]